MIISNITRKILGNTKNQTQGCWVRSKYTTSVLCSPPGRAFEPLHSLSVHSQWLIIDTFTWNPRVWLFHSDKKCYDFPLSLLFPSPGWVERKYILSLFIRTALWALSPLEIPWYPSSGPHLSQGYSVSYREVVRFVKIEGLRGVNLNLACISM